VQADRHAGTERRHRRRLAEDLRVGADRHLEILRPHAAIDQQLLECERLRRAGVHAREVVTHGGQHLAAHGLGLCGVARGLFLDHALEHAGREGDAGRLDGLKVAGREQVQVVGRGGMGKRGFQLAEGA
jgi:hypothetical protein